MFVNGARDVLRKSKYFVLSHDEQNIVSRKSSCDSAVEYLHTNTKNYTWAEYSFAFKPRILFSNEAFIN